MLSPNKWPDRGLFVNVQHVLYSTGAPFHVHYTTSDLLKKSTDPQPENENSQEVECHISRMRSWCGTDPSSFLKGHDANFWPFCKENNGFGI